VRSEGRCWLPRAGFKRQRPGVRIHPEAGWTFIRVGVGCGLREGAGCPVRVSRGSVPVSGSPQKEGGSPIRLPQWGVCTGTTSRSWVPTVLTHGVDTHKRRERTHSNGEGCSSAIPLPKQHTPPSSQSSFISPHSHPPPGASALARAPLCLPPVPVRSTQTCSPAWATISAAGMNASPSASSQIRSCPPPRSVEPASNKLKLTYKLSHAQGIRAFPCAAECGAKRMVASQVLNNYQVTFRAEMCVPVA